MKRAGLTSVATSAALIGLLAGCAAQHEGPQRALTAVSRLRVAEAAEASGDKQTALSMYAAAANDSPNDTQTQLRSAEGLARNGNMEDAAAILARRLKATPHDMDLLTTLGSIQVMSGEQGRAVLTFAEVLAARPNDIKALVNKAVALDILHKHDQAQDLYKKALAESPDDPTINNDLALSLLLSGHREEARLIMLPFRDSRNLPERVRTNMGILDAATGHPVEARDALASRIGAGDLASLTQAISMQGTGFQPDAGRRGVSRDSLVGPIVVHADPVALRAEPLAASTMPLTTRADVVGVPAASRAQSAATPVLPVVRHAAPIADQAVSTPAVLADRPEEPVILRRPLQEQRPVRANSAAVSIAPAYPSGPSVLPLTEAKPVAPVAAPVVTPVVASVVARPVSPVPPPPLPAARGVASAPQTGSVDLHGPLQEDLVPRNLRGERIEATAAPRSLVQEPLAPPETTASHAEGVGPARRPLQEQVTASRDPVAQPDALSRPQRPLQEQAAGTVVTVVPSH